MSGKSINKTAVVLLCSQLWIDLRRYKPSLFSCFLQTWCRVPSEVYGCLEKLSMVNHSCCMQSDTHKISWPWKYAGRGITWSHFSVRHWLSSFILFSSCSLTTLEKISECSFFLTKTRFHIISPNATLKAYSQV